ncbi:uncharacterized protein LOC129615668 [Condylostylus longicornis]|uniref:uncharacterized protein LOC129615668 n=1 Tax=Condylostylus longicornis TaxID=2530218 RepID=UPI00244DA5F9|nr:uncharacterized protein LOC129615668 [Condylostylus longicornis]
MSSVAVDIYGNIAEKLTNLIKENTSIKSTDKDSECRELKKNYWHKKLLQNEDNEMNKNKYRYWLNKFTATKRKKQKEYDIKKFFKCLNNPQKIWNTIKEVINDNIIIEKENEFYNGCKNIKDKTKKITRFNYLYSTIGKEMANNFDSVNYYPRIKTTSRFRFEYITEKKTLKLMGSLSNTKSAGCDIY